MNKLYPEFEAIKKLHEWCFNFQVGDADPFSIYLDLIGFSDEHYGNSLAVHTTLPISKCLGYKELCMLGDALKVFNNNGYTEVYDYILELIDEEEAEE